jgi:hypothetical protein
MFVDEEHYELDRDMINPGKFDSYNARLEIDETIVYLIGMPIVPRWPDDDLFLCDAHGHSYNGSIMRRFLLREAFSDDPYVRAVQERQIDLHRRVLFEHGKREVTEMLRIGARGTRLTDFHYIPGYSDRDIPNPLTDSD